MDFLSRTEMIIGKDNIEKLSSSHVAVFGLGGVGSYVAETLARAGIGNLTLIDNDTVSKSNINRQLFALRSTIGKLKTEVARERIHDINPDCNVNIISKFYSDAEYADFFTCDYTYIVDAIDTVSSKLSLVRVANEKHIPIISCMGTGNKLGTVPFEVADIFSTSVCPLCKVMRHELKAMGIKSLKVVYSKEIPISVTKPDDGIKTGRHIPGSISFVPSMAGLLLAGEVIRYIIG